LGLRGGGEVTLPSGEGGLGAEMLWLMAGEGLQLLPIHGMEKEMWKKRRDREVYNQAEANILTPG
jgi:hypothetical protein